MRLSRRSFVSALAGGALIVGFDTATRSWVASAQERVHTPFERVPRLDGTLALDETTRQAYAQDYGQIIHEQPSAVLRPGSVADIAHMVRFARRFGLRIAARGQGHQPFGQAQVAGGVVDMRSLRTGHAISPDRVDVDAGADWRMVLQAALGQGLTPPVLTAYLGLTVEGTLSIGGIGTTTVRHGAQVDHVLELQVVTGEGQVLTCSEARYRDLFEAPSPVRVSARSSREPSCASSGPPGWSVSMPCRIPTCRRCSRTARGWRGTVASTAWWL